MASCAKSFFGAGSQACSLAAAPRAVLIAPGNFGSRGDSRAVRSFFPHGKQPRMPPLQGDVQPMLWQSPDLAGVVFSEHRSEAVLPSAAADSPSRGHYEPTVAFPSLESRREVLSFKIDPLHLRYGNTKFVFYGFNKNYRGGFDLILGNPSWIKVSWNEGGFMGDHKKQYISLQHIAMYLKRQIIS